MALATLDDKIQALGLEGSNWQEFYTAEQIEAYDVLEETTYWNAVEVAVEWVRVSGNPESTKENEDKAQAVFDAMAKMFGPAQFDNIMEQTRFMV